VSLRRKDIHFKKLFMNSEAFKAVGYINDRPLTANQFEVHGRDLLTLFLDYEFSMDENPYEETLKAYVIYYISAPCYRMSISPILELSHMYEVEPEKYTLAEMLLQLMDYGIEIYG
jgi:hypothetical protein